MSRRPKSPLDPTLAVEYLRVSTEEQNLGTSAQHATIARFALQRGLEIISSHTDHGLSGSLPMSRRPGLSAAIEDLQAHKAGVLLVSARDRLARDILIAASTTRIVEKLGARIESADGTNDESAEGDLLRGMIDLLAQHERAMIRRRTRAALAVKRSRGEKLGGKPPFGTRAEQDATGTLVLVPDEHEQSIIRQILQFTDDKLGASAIARALNKAKVPSRGARWHTTTIVRLLTRERPENPSSSA